MHKKITRLKKERQRLTKLKYHRELNGDYSQNKIEKLNKQLLLIDKAIRKEIEEVNRNERIERFSEDHSKVMKLKSSVEFMRTIEEKLAHKKQNSTQ